MGDVPRAIDWGFLSELFVEMNLTLGEGVSLNELAEFHGVACEGAHARARAERWEEVLTERSRVYERARSASQEWLNSRPDGSNIRLQFLRQGLGPMELISCINAFLAHLGGGLGDGGAGPGGSDSPRNRTFPDRTGQPAKGGPSIWIASLHGNRRRQPIPGLRYSRASAAGAAGRRWQLPDPAPALDPVPADADQAAEREALLEELGETEYKLEALSRCREQLRERLDLEDWDVE